MKINEKLRHIVLDVMHWMVLVLSVLLIMFISIDTFKHEQFLMSHHYMVFQFWVCILFIVDFFVELALSPVGSRWEYVRHRWLFLLLSIPVINIIHACDIVLTDEVMFFIRLLPLARGVLALVIVLDYLCSYRITGIFTSYVSVMLLVGYFGCLIFFECEEPVNPAVSDYWDAFWWGTTQMTTLGSSIYPVTVIGRVISAVLSIMGLLMFPLFTVYLTNVIMRNRRQLNSSVADPSAPAETTTKSSPETL